MVSLIICSKNSQLNPVLRENIAQTIGCDYEIVHIDNSQNKYNIFQAYNLGVERAHGEYLCFMHEDICFHNTGWGTAMQHYLSTPLVGALGVAGGFAVLEQIDWRFASMGQVRLIQSSTSAFETSGFTYTIYRPKPRKHVPLHLAALLDGVLMCFRKELFQKIRFDEENYNSFHLYDSDICMQVNELGYGVFITQDILIEHYSEGTFSPEYAESYKTFARKWKHRLPLIIGTTYTQDEIETYIKRGFQEYDKRLARDMKVTALRRLLADQAQGKATRDLTVEEIRFMDEEAYQFRRHCIKDKQVPSAQVKAQIREYFAMPYAKKKVKLIYKYFWYRFLPGTIFRRT